MSVRNRPSSIKMNDPGDRAPLQQRQAKGITPQFQRETVASKRERLLGERASWSTTEIGPLSDTGKEPICTTPRARGHPTQCQRPTSDSSMSISDSRTHSRPHWLRLYEERPRQLRTKR